MFSLKIHYMECGTDIDSICNCNGIIDHKVFIVSTNKSEGITHQYTIHNGYKFDL